jgi:hypothetical protein
MKISTFDGRERPRCQDHSTCQRRGIYLALATQLKPHSHRYAARHRHHFIGATIMSYRYYDSCHSMSGQPKISAEAERFFAHENCRISVSAILTYACI